MISIRKILFPTDFSQCSEQALRYALFLTKRYQSELHVVHIAVPPENNYEAETSATWNSAVAEERLAERVQAIADQLASKSEHPPIVKEHFVRGTSVAPSLLEYSAEQDFDLIVMGTHGRRGVGHLFLGSVAETMVRHSPCPVLTVREAKEPPRGETPKRILVPIDLSDHSVLALSYAKFLAADYGARLQVLHVVEESLHPSFYAMGRTPVTMMMADILLSAKAETERLIEGAPGPEIPAETFVIQGHAPSDIVRLANEHGSDLIVIATHGLTGIEHFLLGSVTEKVVRTASQPVFTVKSFGKRLLPGLPQLSDPEEVR